MTRFWIGLMTGVTLGAVLTHAVWIAAYGRPFLVPTHGGEVLHGIHLGR